MIWTYIDCVNDGGTYSGTGGPMGYSNASGSIGRKDSFYQGPAWYFSGVIDEFKYWSRDLSEQEIITMCERLDTEDVEQEANLNYDFKLFPNPTDSYINITSNFDKPFDVKIFSIDGREVKPELENQSTIDVSDLKSGMYVVKFIAENGEYLETLKFTKN